MNPSRFSSAGWASIVAGVVFPLAFILEGLTEYFLETCENEYSVGVGPADFVFLLYAALSIYVLMSLKRFMFEHYSFRGINTIINVCIGWTIFFFVGSFALEVALIPVYSPGDVGPPMVLVAFWIIGIAVFGIIDIIKGIILLRHMRQFNTVIKVFAILCLISGICEATIILSFFTFLLVPITYVVLAIAFLQRPKEVEFV